MQVDILELKTDYTGLLIVFTQPNVTKRSIK